MKRLTDVVGSRGTVRHKRRLLGVAVAAATSLLISATLNAGSDSWVGNSSVYFSDLNNWNPAAQPSSGDSLFFDASGSAGANLTDDLMTPGGFSLAGITFNVDASAFTINPNSGGNGFTLAGALTNNGTALQTINDMIAVSGIQTITTNVGGGNITLGGVISDAGGPGALIIAGAGITTLSGANTYSGGTSVSGGTLVVAGAQALGNSANSLSISGGALLKVSAPANTGLAWAYYNSTPGSQAALTGSLSGIQTIVSSFTPTSVTNVTTLGSLPFGTNQYAQAIGSGMINIATAGTYTFERNYADDDAAIFVDGQSVVSGVPTSNGSPWSQGPTPGTIYLSAGEHNIVVPWYQGYGGENLSIQWSGPDTGNNLVDLSTATANLTPDLYLANLSGAGNMALNTGNLIVGFDNSTTSFSGTISGIGGVNKWGAGTLTLSGSNTYTGTTNITTGTLNLGHPLAVQNTTVNVSSTGALTFAAGITSPTLGGLTGTGNVTLTTAASEPVTLNVGNNNASTQYGGSLGGSGGLTKIGMGTLSLTSPQNYTGATVVNAGTLQLGSALPAGTIAYYNFSNPANIGQDSSGNGNNLQTGAGSAAWTAGGKFGGGAVSFNGGSSLVPVSTINGLPVGNSAYTIAGWMYLTDPNNDGIVGWGNYGNSGQVNAFRTNGSGNLLNYWWANDLNAGVPNMQGAWHYVAATWNPVSNSRTIYLDGTVVASDSPGTAGSTSNNFAVGVTNGGEFFNGELDNLLIANSALTSAQISSLMNSTNVNILPTNTALQIASGAALDLNGTSQMVGSLANSGAGGGTVTNSSAGPSTLTVGNDNTNQLFSGTISNGTGGVSLVKIGGGTQTLGGSNTYSGSTTITSGELNLTGTLGGSGGGTAITSNATFNETTTGIIAGSSSLSVAGGTTTLAGSNTFTGATSITGGTLSLTGTLGGGGGGGTAITTSGTLSESSTGAIAGTSSLTVTGGTTTLANSNTFTGATAITGGTLIVGHNLALQNSTVSPGTGGTVNFAQGITAPVFGGLAGNGNISLATVAAENVTLSAGNNGANTTYSGVLSGNGGLTKVGGGTLTVTSVQNYGGATTINNGTLQLNGGTPTPGVLAHRWSFNNSVTDSVGGSTATIFGNTTVGGNQVTINGNGTNGVSYVSLGSNILPTSNSPATIELWATENQVQNWSRILDFGSTAGGPSNLLWSWTQGTSNPSVISPDGVNTNAATFTPGTEYHISLVLTPSGGNTNLTWYQMDSAGDVLSTGTFTPNWNLSQLNQVNMWLGRSEYGDQDASASYDEVRVWDSALTQTQLSALSVAGPDAFFGGGNNVLPASTPVTISAAGTLDLDGTSQQVASLSDGVGGGGSIINSAVATPATLTLSPIGGMATIFSGIISDNGSANAISLVIAGSGTQVLAGANTFSGSTTISSGTLSLGNNRALQNSTVIPTSGGALTFAAGITSPILGGLSGSGNILLSTTASESVALNVGNNGSNTTYSGVLSGNGGLTKVGGGTLSLTAAQNYSGGTTITGGTLQLAAANPAPGLLAHRWSFNNSLTDSVGGSTATIFGNTTLSGNQVTTLGGGTSHVSYVSLGTNILPTTNSPATIELWATENQVESWSRILDFGSTAGAPSDLLWSFTQGTSNPGIISPNGANTNAASFSTGTEYHLALVITPSGSNTNLSWYQMDTSGNVLASGSFLANWNLSQLTQTNMWLGRSEYGDNDADASYDEVRIWDSALTQAQLSTLGAAGPDATFSGGSSILPTMTQVTISPSGTLDLDGTNQQVASLADGVGGGGSIINSAAFTPVTLTFSAAGGMSTFSGVISDNGSGNAISLVMAGNGTQILAGANTFSGSTTINSGTLCLGNNLALQNSTVTPTSGGALTFAAGITAPVLGGLTGGGNITLTTTASESVSLNVGNNSANTTYSGVLSGNGGLTKVGGGTLSLTTAQSYTGATTITGGTLQLVSSTTNPGQLVHRWSFNNSLTDSVGGSTATIYGNTGLGGNQVTINGNGTSHVSYVSLGTNILPATNSPATIELWATENQVQNWSRVLDFGSTAGAPSDLLWSWTQGTNSPGVIAPNGANNNAASFATGTEYHIALVITPNGSNTNLSWYQMDTSGNVLESGSFAANWNLSLLTQTNMWLGRSEYGDNDANASYDEVRIWDTALTQTQLSALAVLGPDASFAGGSSILPTGSPLVIAPSGTLDLDGTNQQVASLADGTGGGGTIINSSAYTPVTLMVSAAGGTTTFSGTIKDNGVANAISVAVSGSGTQILTGSNTYSGGTTITGGALLVNNTAGSGTGSGPVVVSGGRLGGTGTIGGNVSINAGGTISPGATTHITSTSLSPTVSADVGTLTTTGNMTWNGGGTYAWKTTLASGWSLLASTAGASGSNQDFLNVAGTLDVEQGFVLDIVHPLPPFPSPSSSTFIIANVGAVTTNNGMTPELAGSDISTDFVIEDNGQQIYGDTVEVVQDGTSGLDIEVTVTPEPGSLGLLGVASLGLLRRRRTNRQ